MSGEPPDVDRPIPAEELTATISDANDPEFVRRLVFVRSLYAGDAVADAADRVGCSVGTGWHWLTTWNEGGIDALRPTRPLIRRGLVACYVVVSVVVVAVSAGVFFGTVNGVAGSVFPADYGILDAARVPPYVYLFALVGGFGYVFTALIDDEGRSVGDLLQDGVRLVAALPLAAGSYLLLGFFRIDGGASAPTPVVGGIAFLTGLSVNVAHKRFASLAKRLLPADGDA
ncbi:helix-turn-helix domain-containing protein [Haloplanus salilacus]|uniref:helix-turn-helix domain-containing protein n=1 Tax=Haloplanus salilacus TaxID=2949994 RepID=UPI0030CCE59C